MGIFENVRGSVWLAPMAGVSDSAFRRVCRRFGADFVVSEMISAKALVMGDRKSRALMRFTDYERPVGVQLFGARADDIFGAVRIVENEASPDFIDINMGCPAPKITSGGAGSALLLTPDLACEIVRAAAAAAKAPVSVKMRSGYKEVTAPELAPRLERAGASLIAVHGRTRERMYAPPVDLEVIAALKRLVKVPVVGNGDIMCGEDAERMTALTGCDAVMVGRGALGNPFVFAEIKARLHGEEAPPQPTLERRLGVLRGQVEEMIRAKGDYIGIQEARKHAAWYLKGMRGAARLRALANGLKSLDDLDRLISEALRAEEQ